ncbi:MAG: DUF3240 family protein [Chromatiaceae bacterium]|nr:DUF3240 family protein [Chromatiaceae bacterium]
MTDLEMLHVFFPLDLRDAVVDALLELDELSGFSIVPIDGHSRDNSQLDKLEQVVGYRRMFRLEIIAGTELRQRVIALLRECRSCRPGDKGIRYYVTAVLDSGHI